MASGILLAGFGGPNSPADWEGRVKHWKAAARVRRALAPIGHTEAVIKVEGGKPTRVAKHERVG
jgi:hypothetical protein